MVIKKGTKENIYLIMIIVGVMAIIMLVWSKLK